MSDPVSNAEIEDVLSSIRRLVSVDKRDESREAETARGTPHPNTSAPTAGAEHATPEPQATAGAGAARLVLTPSFRVSPEEEVTADASSEDAEHLTLEQWQVTPDTQVDAASSDAGEADELGSDAWEDDHGEDESLVGGAAEPWPEVDDDAMAASHDDMRPDDDAHLKDWLNAENATDDATGDSQDDMLSEHGDAPASADFEASESAEDDVTVGDTDPDVAEDETETLDREPEQSELEARIAEVEAAVAAREDQWEPDGESEDAYAGGRTEPLPWEDHVEPTIPVFFQRAAHQDAAAAPEAEADDETQSPDTSASGASKSRREADESFDERQAEHSADKPRDAESWYHEDTDAVLDEDALRDLVSEIVRQELQGTLGERITRNVRKLVRREIHRAMAGQELD